ncbi:MAG: hypothetical protein JSU92_07230 [Deltaproteobacteria bacterium]|nr:MAG: hypothetical protein JSU92_07230 [Deltaproteobacteria bacterium]
MKKFVEFIMVICLVLAFSVIPAEAKDLSKRVGLGYNSQIETIGVEYFQIDGPSIKYGISPDIGIQGILGFSNYSNGVEFSVLVLGGKFFYNIIKEENMNFYAGGGLGIISLSNAADETGIFVCGYVGEEFFFSGLPNLGFSAEMGLVIESMDDLGSYVGTYGGFLEIGINYYF